MRAGNGDDRKRFGQLTYASFDAGVGTAGWQVKETAGALSVRERELLTARIATRLDIGAVPSFPTPDEVERLPRRLVYNALPEGGTAYWHTAVAGMDASGRPGNVFVHAVLDRRPDTPDTLRPVELWRSPDWLTPFNPEQVVGAILGDAPRPGAGPSTGRAATVDFLLDPRQWRIGVLSVLLDAVAAALTGGSPAVLAVSRPEDAAGWVAAVSHLMSPGTARRLYFSTLETGETVRAAIDSGLHLVCIPRDHLAELPRELPAVVLDDAGDADLGSMDGEPHHAARGEGVAVTPWSGLAQVALADARTASGVLEAADAIAAEVGDAGLPPDWPLAAAALVHIDALPDARHDAARAVLASSPPLDGVPELAAAVARGVTAIVGADAREAWAHLHHVHAGHWSAAAGIVLDVYIRRVLDERSWLTRPEGVPVPDLSRAEAPRIDPGTLLERIADLGRRGANHGGGPSVDLAVETVRLADFLARARVLEGLPLPDATRVYGALETELQRLVVPVCLGQGSAGLATAAGPAEPGLLEEIRSLLELEIAAQAQVGDLAPLGERIAGPALTWLLGATPSRPPHIEDAVMGWAGAGAVSAEHAVAAYLETRNPAMTRAAIVSVLDEAARGRPVSRLLDLSEMATEARLATDEIAVLIERYGHHLVPEALFVPALKSEPLSPALASICQQVAPVPWEDGLMWQVPPRPRDVEVLVRLRSMVRMQWTIGIGHQATERAAHIYRYARRALQIAPEVSLNSGVVAHAQAAWLQLTLEESPLVGGDKDVQLTGPILAGPDGVAVLDLVDRLVGGPGALAYAALVGKDSPLGEFGASRADLNRLRVDVGGRVEPAMDAVVRRRLAEPDLDPTQFVDSAVALTSHWLADSGLGGTERGLESWRRYLEHRAKQLGARSGVLGTALGRLRAPGRSHPDDRERRQ